MRHSLRRRPGGKASQTRARCRDINITHTLSCSCAKRLAISVLSRDCCDFSPSPPSSAPRSFVRFFRSADNPRPVTSSTPAPCRAERRRRDLGHALSSSEDRQCSAAFACVRRPLSKLPSNPSSRATEREERQRKLVIRLPVHQQRVLARKREGECGRGPTVLEEEKPKQRPVEYQQ